MKVLKKIFQIFQSGDQARLKWLAVILAIIIGLVFLVVGNPFDNPQQSPVPPQMMFPDNQTGNSGNIAAVSGMVQEEQYLARKMSDMLELVAGAGKVQVTVRFKKSARFEYVVNTNNNTKTTREQDQTGGTRILNDNNYSGQMVLLRSGNATEKPVLQQEIAPHISGVLVVAEGAGDPVIKEKLFRAVQVGMGIEPQKILVLTKSIAGAVEVKCVLGN